MCTENCNGCANSCDDDENIDIESCDGCVKAVVMMMIHISQTWRLSMVM